MSISAVVENNTIKLPPGVHLPDGTRVMIATRAEPRGNAVSDDALPHLGENPADDPIFRLHLHTVDIPLTDASENHDRYLY